MVVDILEKEDLTDMGLLSGTGNFLVRKAGDLLSESPEKYVTEIFIHFYHEFSGFGY